MKANKKLKLKLKNLASKIAIISTISILAGCGAKDNSLQPTPLTKYKSKISVNKKWSSSIGSGSGDSAYVIGTQYSDKRLITASINGDIKALSPENGEKLWSKSSKFKFSATPLVANNTIYIGTILGELAAFDEKNGNLKWKTQLESSVLAQPAYSNNMIFVNTNNNIITAVNAITGKIIWSHENKTQGITLQGTSSPVIDPNNDVMFASDDGTLTLLSNNKGEVKWSKPIFAPTGDNMINRMVDIHSTPIIDQDILYIMGYNSDFKCIDLTDGQIFWKREFAGYRNMAQDPRNIYLVTSDSKVVALDKASGKTLWMQSKLLGRVLSAPAVLNNKYILVGDLEGYVHFLDISTGEILARYKANSSSINAAPSIVNNTAIINTVDGEIVALTIAKK